ncbi:MAG: hypothetical protein WB762_00520 [Candidatus Sulfotelmatobacter sp.]
MGLDLDGPAQGDANQFQTAQCPADADLSQEEFANAQENCYSEGDRIRGEWHGKLAKECGLQGEVRKEYFGRPSLL